MGERIYETHDGLHCYLKEITTRSTQNCLYCHKQIQKGEKAIIFQGQTSGMQRYYRQYTCSHCYKVIESDDKCGGG